MNGDQFDKLGECWQWVALAAQCLARDEFSRAQHCFEQAIKLRRDEVHRIISPATAPMITKRFTEFDDGKWIY